MKIKKNIYLLFIIFLLGCCKGKDQAEIYNIRVNYNTSKVIKSVGVEQLFCNKKVVRLETVKESMITSISRLILHEEKILIFDITQAALFIFNIDGKFLTKIKKIGKGPEEYIQLIDFAIINNEIVMHSAIPEKLIYYDFKGNFLRMEERDRLDLYISTVDDALVCASFSSDKNDYYIRIKENNVTSSYMPVENHMLGKQFSGERPNLIKSNNLYFFKAYDNVVYKVDTKGCSPKYEISVIGKVFVDQTKLDDRDLQTLSAEPSNTLKINDFRDYNSHCIFTIYPEHKIVIHNKKSGKTQVIAKFHDAESGLSLSANNYLGHDGEGENVLFSVEAIQFIENINGIKSITNQLEYNTSKRIADELTPNDNPVVIIYNFK